MRRETTPGPTTSDRWIVLGIVYLSFLAYAAVFQSIPPIVSLIIADLRLSHATAGLLMSLFALPGIFLSIPVGLLVDRRGPRIPMIACLIATIVGTLLVAVGPTFPILAIGRVIAGAGGLSLFVVGSKYVAEWFVGRELGIAIGIYSTALPVATILALNTLGTVAIDLGWRDAVLVTVGLASVALVAFVALYRPAPSDRGPRTSPAPRTILALVKGLGLAIWLDGIVWLLFNAAVIAFLTFAPDYFIARGYGIAVAGFLTSLLMLPSPFLAPLVGYLLDRLGHDEVWIGLGGLIVAGSIFATPSSGMPLVGLLLLLGLGSAIVPTPVFALPTKLLRPRDVGTGYGIVNTCLNVGVVVGPLAAGFARDATGSYQLSFDLMAGFALLVLFAAGALWLARGPARLQAAHRR
ncbi:MAG: MFS transporter [Chloroflexota bacterium]